LHDWHFDPIRKYPSNNFYQSIDTGIGIGIDAPGGAFSACPFGGALVR
jgi:hypothetical protein